MLIYVVRKRFFSETTWKIETNPRRNDHWKVLYKFYVFYADRKSKMATTALHKLTLDPMMYSLALIIFVVSEKNAF
jgi:hypothetical protein